MTPWEMENAMNKRGLPDAERVAIRNGYFNLVLRGWPTQHITLAMCAEADQGQFVAWTDCLTLMDYETRRAQQRLRDEMNLPLPLFGSAETE
jgi:hypothetical protein